MYNFWKKINACEEGKAMIFFQKMLINAFLLVVLAGLPDALGVKFTYNNGFQSANLSLDGIAGLSKNGLLKLSNESIGQSGHAFHPDPIAFKNSSNGEAFSFSTSFVFAIRPQLQSASADGFAFVIAPTKVLPLEGSSLGFLGLFNASSNGSTANHVFAVEFDTLKNPVSNDISNNHVAIDIDSITSKVQEQAGYYGGSGLFKNLTLSSGEAMQVWVDYDGRKKQITVTLAPLSEAAKPSNPLINLPYDLSEVMQEKMYVGFSTSTGLVNTIHYIVGWSFGSQGELARNLDISQLPRLPKIGGKKVSPVLTIGLPLVSSLTILAAGFSITFYVLRKKKFAEVLEDWEVDYRPHRFKYKNLYTATKGFRETELLGAGGFGKVYRGVLPATKLEVAVKKISHDSRQGIREFVAEIISIGRMSHRNLVPLFGYCRRKSEFLLVYECMPNGSLDKFLHSSQNKLILTWAQRFRIIKGVASGLFYLHEGWEQVVIHRDVKPSNVMLDGEWNARLGDFGLAKLYDHETDPQTTHVVGTLGYLAPEQYRTGRATTSSDVYAFGTFLLEVVSGRRPIDLRASEAGDVLLAEWVFSCWSEGRILEAVDEKLRDDFISDEAELVLKIGLLCCNSEPKARPSMQKVMLYMDGSMPLPELPRVFADGITLAHGVSFGGVLNSLSDTSSNSQPSHGSGSGSQYRPCN